MMQDPRQIDLELRKKYDVRGPRYTSYPPANHFKSIDLDELFRRWQTQNHQDQDNGLSQYYHIPFCRSRCLFCGCHTYIGKKETETEQYIDRLVHEMELAAAIVDTKRPVHQIAVGGGTPNFLTTAQTNRLFSQVRKTWKIDPAAELSVEIDPRTITTEKLDTFLNFGFNRFSLGVQDFSKDVLKIVRHGQDLMQVEEVVGHLRKKGCQSINFDLIYGLCKQTVESAAQTAEQVIELRPSRIALYSYAHVPWLQPHQKAMERHGLVPPELKAEIFLLMLDKFQAAGYLPIGMDHFALPDDPLAKAFKNKTLRRNFMGYTTGRGLDLLAFGASAISSIGSAYSQNEKELNSYDTRLAQDQLPIMRGFLLDKDDLIRRELIIELFCNFYVDLTNLSDKFAIEAGEYFAKELDDLSPMIADRLVTVDQQAIEVTQTGRFFIRNICMTFDRYLKDSTSQAYSRTI
jgi:oxygen-independent coproporphyrinogen-3 oxidase